MNENLYQLTITSEALKHIRSEGSNKYQDAYALVLADSHAIGGVIVPEIHPIEVIMGNMHFRQIFSPDYRDYGFPVYLDRTMEREGYVPEHMLIDYELTHAGMDLVFKNPDFEN
ncbi:MAG: hypothetical protein DRO88_11430 [Promethearchaeia archaeon]|nr:MAG: hypothetical protein DRO88_11430 [Candidatus Lokiarchaeia archaeon]